MNDLPFSHLAQCNREHGYDEPCDKPFDLNTITECDACEGDLSAESERVVCYTDGQIADHDYVQGPYHDGKCEIDGWNKFEHELNRDLVVHGSCFLEHDDVLVRL